MKIYAIANQKGGVAKTTSTANLGAGLARAGKRVLLIDLDPQSSLTYICGIEAHDLPIEKTIFGMLTGDAKAADVILSTSQGFDIIPSNIALSLADLHLGGHMSRERLLKKALRDIDYDIVLIDCPPALGLLTINAFTVADALYVPVIAEKMVILGVRLLLETIERMKEDLNPDLVIGGMFLTIYEKQLNIAKAGTALLEEQFGDTLMETRIRKNTSLKEAPAFCKSIFDYDEKSNGAEDYAALVQEFMKREGL